MLLLYRNPTFFFYVGGSTGIRTLHFSNAKTTFPFVQLWTSTLTGPLPWRRWSRSCLWTVSATSSRRSTGSSGSPTMRSSTRKLTTQVTTDFESFFYYLSVKVTCLFELSFMHDLVRLVLWHTVGRYLKAVLRSRSRWSRNYLRPRAGAGAEAAWSRNYLNDKYLVQTVWRMLGWRKTNFYLYWYSTTTTVIEQF